MHQYDSMAMYEVKQCGKEAVLDYFKYCSSGSTVVKVLCYKSEGRWFDSRWCHWNFSLT